MGIFSLSTRGAHLRSVVSDMPAVAFDENG